MCKIERKRADSGKKQLKKKKKKMNYVWHEKTRLDRSIHREEGKEEARIDRGRERERRSRER